MSKDTAGVPLVLPRHARGMRIGLFGGSFDPPHAGHRHASLLALKRLGLDRVWWLVTPGNPLKANDRLPSLAGRIAAARVLADHPRIDVSGVEEVIGARYTADTLAWLVGRCPGVRFVWLMGADGLIAFHRWKDWREIASLVPIAVVDRPGHTLRTASAKAALALAPYRIDEREARRLPLAPPPAWTVLHGPRSALSSTELRARERR